MIFFIIIAILILVGTLTIFLKYRETKYKYLIYIFAVTFASALFFVPYFDPLQLPGFWASVILQNSDPTLYGFIVGLIVINCGIYGIHIFLSSANLLRAERYRGRLITIGQFSKRRFPIYVSYHLIGLSYLILMGSATGVTFLSLMMVFLFSDTAQIEKNRLIPRYKNEYYIYQNKVPKRMYSREILIILIVEYILFLIGVIFTFIL